MFLSFKIKKPCNTPHPRSLADPSRGAELGMTVLEVMVKYFLPDTYDGESQT
jgi:hypothetical protein